MKNKTALKRLFEEIAPRYQSRRGGYSRVLKVMHRMGDGAPMSILELVERKVKEPPPEEKAKKRGKKGKKKGKEEEEEAAAEK